MTLLLLFLLGLSFVAPSRSVAADLQGVLDPAPPASVDANHDRGKTGTAVQHRTALGVEGGLTFGSLSSNDSLFMGQRRLGLAAGMCLIFDLDEDDDDDDLSFLFGILAGTKGAKFNAGNNQDQVLGLKYLDVFPAVRYQVWHQHNYALNVFGGASLGLKWGEHQTIGGQTIPTQVDFAKRYDLGLTFGADLKFAPKMDLTFRYTQGLTNIVATPGTNNFSVHNRAIQLTYGYRVTKF